MLGALYHPPGGIIRHDAVVWGFARGADRARRRDPSVHRGHGLQTSRTAAITASDQPRHGQRPGTVLSATAGWSTLVCALAGVELPITTHILQACVTEPVKPLLDVVIVSSQMHVYISQSDRGEFVMGSEIEPWTTYRMQGTLNFLQDLTRHTLELFPQLEHARLLRTWAGLCDLPRTTARSSAVTEVENFHVSAGWGTYGFKAAPIVGKTLAELVAHRRDPGADRPVRARALLHRQARLRAGGRRRQPLSDYNVSRHLTPPPRAPPDDADHPIGC